MPKIEESLNEVSLKYILDPQDLEELKKNPIFQNIEENEYCYDKNELLLKFVSLAIDKFRELKDNTLCKCFKWVQNQLKTNLEIKPDVYSLNKIENLEKEKPSVKMRLGWLKEYSALSKENHLYTMLGKQLQKSGHKYSLSTDLERYAQKKEEAPNMGKRKSMNQNIASSSIIMKLGGAAENIILENENFNIFEFEKKIGKEHILPSLSVYVLNFYELFDEIVPYNKFENFVYEIAKGYHRENPYHTDLHAADMLQSIFTYNLYSKFQVILNLSEIDLLSIFVSAIIHDYGHPGLNNNYLIRTKDNLSIKYNDISVLENYHVSEAFNIILKKQDNNILSNLSDDDYKLCRKNIIECVLGTDMTLHNQKYQTFKIRLQTENIKKGEGLEQFLLKQDPINLYNLKLEFLSFIIHAADISNPTKPLPIYREWAQRCVEEFFKQGDLEKKLGLPISFNCDRNTVSLPKSQLGFMDAIVSPLFTVFNEYFPQISFTLDNLKKNHKYYKEIVEKEKNLKK
jgi:hypothetical protein